MKQLELNLASKLVSAGLHLHGFAPETTQVTPKDAWSRVARLDLSPVAVYAPEPKVQLDKLQKDWMGRATSGGIISAAGTFLLSVGVNDLGKLPWARVGLTDHVDIGALAAHPDEPEFICMDASATNLCAVTTEENGLWLVMLKLV